MKKKIAMMMMALSLTFESPAAFDPKPLFYQVKKESPITISQKRYLNDLIKYHRIETDAVPEKLTKSEASRMIDNIISRYGKIKR